MSCLSLNKYSAKIVLSDELLIVLDEILFNFLRKKIKDAEARIFGQRETSSCVLKVTLGPLKKFVLFLYFIKIQNAHLKIVA